MKNQVRILFALMLCLFICQTNVQGQIFKKALNSVKGAVSSVSNKVTGGKSKGGDADRNSTAPAKAEAPDVKNSISEIRAFTGITKDAFLAKMKSQGFVEDPTGGYKSKSKGYVLSIEMGTRGKETLICSVKKTTETKNANLATVKTNFLGLVKQSTDLKAKFVSANLATQIIKGSDVKKGSDVHVSSSDGRTSKYLPALDKFFSAKENGGASESYEEKDYRYGVEVNYISLMGSTATVSVQVEDLTINSDKG
jgi:hypothetical protein